jgi:hypothetical protein
MQLQDILYSQGFGTRRVCAGLIQQGWVQMYGDVPGAPPQSCTDALAEFAPEGLRMRVQGQDWPYYAKAYVMLHKPAATECSQKPSTYPSIYTLLPSPLRLRPQKGAVQGVQAPPDGSSPQDAGLADGAFYADPPATVAMSANVASQYDWYQISGNATIKNHGQKFTVRLLAKLAEREDVTLLCHCAEDTKECHRFLLRDLIEREATGKE